MTRGARVATRGCGAGEQPADGRELSRYHSGDTRRQEEREGTARRLKAAVKAACGERSGAGGSGRGRDGPGSAGGGRGGNAGPSGHGGAGPGVAALPQGRFLPALRRCPVITASPVSGCSQVVLFASSLRGRTQGPVSEQSGSGLPPPTNAPSPRPATPSLPPAMPRSLDEEDAAALADPVTPAAGQRPQPLRAQLRRGRHGRAQLPAQPGRAEGSGAGG